VLKTVQWDGPHPKVGDVLLGKSGEAAQQVRAVLPALRDSLHRITLDLVRLKKDQMPAHAVVHPMDRCAPSDPAGPARVRQLARDGAARVVPARWRDPDDLKPNASRQQRLVTGYRTFCPLRRMSGGNNSQITERHIAAADHLRTMFDIAGLGLTPVVDLSGTYAYCRPRLGPNQAALGQARAESECRIALARFTTDQNELMIFVVLGNKSLYAWCAHEAARRGLVKSLDAKIEMGRLLAILDILVDHFHDHIEARLFAGMAL
jgi:hypothetical protein